MNESMQAVRTSAPIRFEPGAAIRQHLLRLQRRQAIPALVLPGLASAVLFAIRWHAGATPGRVAMLIGFYALSMAGITVGYHRLLSHNAFECRPWMKAALLLLAFTAGEGPPIFWIATHRKHHSDSDGAGDPHSPHAPEAALRGFAHAHMGWMLTELPADPLRYAKDTLKDPVIVRLGRYYVHALVLGVAVPAILGAIVFGGFTGFLDGLLWGGTLRLFCVQHATWCINSVCHVWGARPYATRDESRNNLMFGILALGEGWHNNHHAAPSSAKHGFRWYQIDLSWWLIRAMCALGIAHSPKLPDLDKLARRHISTTNRSTES